jgi:hypothetical protein
MRSKNCFRSSRSTASKGIPLFLLAGLLFFQTNVLSADENLQRTADPDITPLLSDDGRFLSPPLELIEGADIGLEIAVLLERFGPPQAMFSARGDEGWQDDVVFFYPDYRYYYWFENRVWQIRYDFRYNREVSGVRMGMSMDEVTGILGPAHYSGRSSLFYDLSDTGYPRRFRLFFQDGLLHDMYIYRSDF